MHSSSRQFDNSIADEVLRYIKENCITDETGPMWEKVERSAARLNACRSPAPPLRPVVMWAARMVAFTVPGDLVFLSRELLQRFATDAPVAFVLAHEMAHHDLGHLDAWNDVGRVTVARVLLRVARSRLCNPEQELEADAYALQLCSAAGYDEQACLQAFKVLEANALDYHDVDGVYGIFDEVAQQTSHRLRRWWWERKRGYQSLVDRRERLEQIIALNRGHQSGHYREGPAPDPVCPLCGQSTFSSGDGVCIKCRRKRRVQRSFEKAWRAESRRAVLRDLLPLALVVVAFVVACFVGALVNRTADHSSSGCVSSQVSALCASSATRMSR